MADTVEMVKDAMQRVVGLSRVQADRLDRIERRLGGDTGDGAAGVAFLNALRNSRLGLHDDRMLASVSTYGSERVSADGGYAVPAAWTPEVQRVLFGDSFLGAVRPRPVESSIFKLPKDTEAPWSASGVTAATVEEGSAITASKPALGLLNVVLYKRAALLHVSEEAVTDNPVGFLGYARDVLLARVREAAEAWVIAGTGLNEPLGILNAPGRIEVAKESGQTAATIVAANVAKMAARITRFADSIWVAHPTCLGQLAALAGTIYSGSGGPAGSVLGRPVYLSESMLELGNAGDLALVDPAGVVVPVRGPRLVDTAFFAFDQGLQSFRCSFWIGCATLVAAPIARKNGSSTASHVVTLATRS